VRLQLYKNQTIGTNFLTLSTSFDLKIVYLIRHAKSSWEDPSLPDSKRPLNHRGLRDAPFMAKLLSDKGVEPDLLLSSPANRALTTANFFAAAFDFSPASIVQNEDIYEALPKDILRIITNLPPENNTVLLFGHNPTFTSIANHFTPDDYIDNVPTCGIVKIEAMIDDWKSFTKKGKVTAFHYPKQFFK